MNDDQRLQSAALTWLYEMEMLSSSAIQKNLKENILLIDPSIKDCEFLIFEERKDILVYLQVGFFAKFFRKELKLIRFTEEVIGRLLPSYRQRIITDRAVFDLALLKVRRYYGGLNDKENSNHNNVNEPLNSSSQNPQPPSKSSDIQPNSQEPTGSQS